MNEGETPTGDDAKEPIFFSSEDTANSASGHSVFDASNQTPAEPEAPATPPVVSTSSSNGESNHLFANRSRRTSGQRPTENPTVITPATPSTETPAPNASSTPDFFSRAMANQTAPAPAPKKRWPLILGITIGVLLIGGIVASAFLLPGGGSVSPDSLEAKFNTFANYLLFGEEKSDKLPEYDEDATYRFTEMYSDTESADSQAYMEKLDTLFDTFVDGYQAKNASEAVDAYIDNYRLVQSNTAEVQIPETQIIQNLIDGGLESAKDMITTHYSSNAVSENPLTESYQKIDHNYLSILAIYQQAGCIEGYFVDEECASAIVNPELQALSETQTALFEEVETKTSDSMKAVIEDIWSVSSAIGEIK